jgi:PAS domain-containing protein
MNIASKEPVAAAQVEAAQREKVERSQRELEECHNHLEHRESLFAHVPEAMLIAEPNGSIVDANPAARMMLNDELV